MSPPVPATAAVSSVNSGLDAWFIGLGQDFLGRVPESSLRPGMHEGWLLAWRGREVQVEVDSDFPFSLPRIYLMGYTRAHAQPHIERDGKLCLGAKPIPGDALGSVQASLAEAFRLLAENETKQHDDDFQEDFGAYWLTWASRPDLCVEVLPGPRGTNKTTPAASVLTNNRIYVFSDKTDAARFWTNFTGNPPKKLKTTAIVSIAPLPAPDRYPNSSADLWTLVETRSEGGADVLARLIANDPKEAFIVLTGVAPSGRDHYAALRIHRPLDRSGQPVNRSAMRKRIDPAKETAKSVFERYQIERLATNRLDVASTRLPAGIGQDLSTAVVIVVGCGALGSGVARLLAQAGVEHMHLVDPENLGWENIRRHELGARYVDHGKARTLALTIRADLPTIRLVEGYRTTFAAFAREHPETLQQADLVVTCTGNWAADASVENILTQASHKASAVYGWMETHALAAHAVLIGNSSARLSDGFDRLGEFRLPAVSGGRPPPPECGGGSTPFGAIELSNAQALVARLALDALLQVQNAPAWRTWLANASALHEAEASWAPGWIAKRGKPEDIGGLYQAGWTF